MGDENRSRFLVIHHRTGLMHRAEDPHKVAIWMLAKDVNDVTIYRRVDDVPPEFTKLEQLLSCPEPPPPPQPLVEVVKVLLDLIDPVGDVFAVQVSHERYKAGVRAVGWREIPVGIFKTLADLVRPRPTDSPSIPQEKTT